MKVIFSNSFLEDASREDIVLRFSRYALVNLSTSVPEYKELLEDDISILGDKFGKETTSSIFDIDGIWELESDILKFSIDISSLKDNPKESIKETSPYNLLYFYYKNIYDEEKLAFVLVPDQITKATVSDISKYTLGLCYSRNLVKISVIPGRKCGFDFINRDEDISFLEGTNKVSGVNIFANISQESLVFKKSYKKYLIWGDRENYSETDVDFFFNEKGELLSDKYIVTEVKSIYIDSDQSFIDSTGRKIIYIGGEQETVYLRGYYNWERYEVFEDDRRFIDSGSSDIKELTNGTLKVTKIDREGFDLDIKYTTDFKEKEITILDAEEKGKGEIQLSIQVINYIDDINGIEVVESENYITIIQERNDWYWNVDYSEVTEQYKENGFPLLVEDYNQGSSVKIILTTNSEFVDFIVGEGNGGEEAELLSAPKNSLTVECDFPDWDRWFNRPQLEYDPDTFKYSLIISTSRLNNSNGKWYPISSLTRESEPARFTLILGGNKYERFYVVQKPQQNFQIELFRKSIEGERVEFSPIIAENGITLYNDPNYPNENLTSWTICPTGNFESRWSLVSGQLTKREYFDNENNSKLSISIQPQTGFLSEYNPKTGVKEANESSFTLKVWEENFTTDKIYLGNLILTTATSSSGLIDESNWRELICSGTCSIPVYLGKSEPYMKICPYADDINSDILVLDGGLQYFKFYVRTNTAFNLKFDKDIIQGVGEEKGSADIKFITSPTDSSSALSEINYINNTYNLKEPIEFGAIISYLGYEDADISSTILLGQLIGTFTEKESKESPNGYLNIAINKSTKDQLISDESGWCNKEQLQKYFKYGIWLDNIERTGSWDVDINYSLKSISAQYNQLVLTPGVEVLFNSNPNHTDNHIKNQTVYYTGGKYSKSTLGIEYDIKGAESIKGRYPTDQFGSYRIQPANIDGNNSSISNPSTIIPVFMKRDSAKLMLSDTDSDRAILTSPFLEVPYDVYSKAEGDIDFTNSLSGSHTFFRDVEINLSELPNYNSVVLGDGCELDLAEHSLSLCIDPDDNPPNVGEDENGEIPVIKRRYLIKVRGNVVIKNGIIKDFNKINDLFSVFYLEDSAILTLENMYVESNNTIFALDQYSELTINSGIYKCYEDKILFKVVGKECIITTKGGTFFSEGGMFNIPDFLANPNFDPISYVKLLEGKFYHLDPEKDFNLNSGLWGEDKWLGDDEYTEETEDGYIRIRSNRSSDYEQRETVTFDIRDYFKFYVRSRYKFVEDNIWDNINILGATPLEKDNRYRSEYPNNINWFEINRTDKEPEFKEDYWVYEFEIFINGVFIDPIVSICLFEITYRMDLGTLVKNNPESQIPWIEFPENGKIIKDSTIDSICPPVTLTVPILWRERYQDTNPLYTEDQFDINCINSCEISGGEFTGTISYRTRKNDSGDVINPEGIFDWRIISSSGFDKIETTGDKSIRLVIQDYLSRYENSALPLNNGFEQYAEIFRDLGKIRELSFTIEWRVKEGMEDRVRDPKQTFIRTIYITQKRLPYVSFVQYTNGNCVVGIPNLTGGTLLVTYSSTVTRFFAAFFPLEGILNYLDRGLEYVAGEWPTWKTPNSSTNRESYVLSEHFLTKPIYRKGVSLWAQEGSEIFIYPSNNSVNSVSRDAEVGFNSDGYEFSIKINVAQNPNPYGDIISPGYEDGCTICFSASGYSMTGYKYSSSANILIPLFKTTKSLDNYGLKITYVDKATGNNPYGHDVPVSFSYITMPDIDSYGRRTYIIMVRIPHNTSGKVIGLPEDENAQMSAVLKLESSSKEIIWKANIVQGTVTCRPHNIQKLGSQQEEIDKYPSGYGGVSDPDSLSYDPSSKHILGPINLGYNSTNQDGNKSDLSTVSLVGKSGLRDIISTEVNIDSIGIGTPYYWPRSTRVNDNITGIEFGPFSFFESIGAIPPYLEIDPMNSLSMYRQESYPLTTTETALQRPYTKFKYSASSLFVNKNIDIRTKLGYRLRYREDWRSYLLSNRNTPGPEIYTPWMYFAIHYQKPQYTQAGTVDVIPMFP